MDTIETSYIIAFIVGFIIGCVGANLLLKYCPRFEAFTQKIFDRSLGRLLDRMGW